MSELVEYLNKIEKDVEKWPSWKKKSLKEALQLSSKTKIEQPKISRKKALELPVVS